MAVLSVERALRAELELLRAELAVWDAANVLLSKENAALRAQLAELAGQVAELVRRLGQGPRNSHKPTHSVRYALTCAGSLPFERRSPTPHTATASSTASRGTASTSTPIET